MSFRSCRATRLMRDSSPTLQPLPEFQERLTSCWKAMEQQKGMVGVKRHEELTPSATRRTDPLRLNGPDSREPRVASCQGSKEPSCSQSSFSAHPPLTRSRGRVDGKTSKRQQVALADHFRGVNRSSSSKDPAKSRGRARPQRSKTKRPGAAPAAGRGTGTERVEVGVKRFPTQGCTPF